MAPRVPVHIGVSGDVCRQVAGSPFDEKRVGFRAERVGAAVLGKHVERYQTVEHHARSLRVGSGGVGNCLGRAPPGRRPHFDAGRALAVC